jgi:hypothetical protein
VRSVSNLLPVQVILVPQGAEYKAVCKGLGTSKANTKEFKPVVLPIPIGVSALSRWLEIWRQRDRHLPDLSSVLVMGLAGSLNPRFGVGNAVLYKSCAYLMPDADPRVQSCDRSLTELVQSRLGEKVSLVNALTSDRFVYAAREKRFLGQTYGVDAVDMEGIAVLDALNQADVAVSMLRVIGDDCQHDMPDLTTGMGAEGVLLPFPLAIGLLRQPIAATRLIRSSLRGLNVLQDVTAALFSASV